MVELEADVAILGSGFGGSLLALILERIGLRVTVVDAQRHPRFTIGESSTPIASMVLRDLATRYDLPRLWPLAKYSSADSAYPQIMMGKKRGFSYFRHESGQAFSPDDAHSNELLVTASKDDEQSDANWLRADLDQFVAREVQNAGIPLLEGANVTQIERGGGWKLSGQHDAEPFQIRATFLVDASGERRTLLRWIGVEDDADQLLTNSRAAYAHFDGLAPWQDLLQAHSADVGEHPFPCDEAALHHLLDDSWMWWLRFRNGVTSVGLVTRGQRAPVGRQSEQNCWDRTIQNYPSLANALRGARVVAPSGGLRFTGRLQRLARIGAGPDWAALPHTIGFIDPLHSTGIAQTLCGIERLSDILSAAWNSNELPSLLKHYDFIVHEELRFVDLLVHGCYASINHFPLFATYSMHYFAAAIIYEHRRAQGQITPMHAFLSADERPLVEETEASLKQLAQIHRLAKNRSSIEAFADDVRRRIAPYNIAGLCDPSVKNMYRYTAAPLAESP